MIEVSRAYYLDDKSKSEISAQLGISRFKVARLLDEARASGVVTISVNDDGVGPDMAEQLKEHLGIRHAIVIETHGDATQARAQVGRATGAYLQDTLTKGELLGLAWGRTLTAMTDDLDRLPAVDSVQLNGVLGYDLPNPVSEIVRTVAMITGRPARAIFAPYYIDDARTAAALRCQPEVAAVLAAFDRVTTAVASVGSLTPRVTRVLDSLPAHVQELLLNSGAQAEFCGIPFDESGQVIDPRFLRHCLSISVDQLRKVNRVIASAAGSEKARAMMSVCRSGIINEVIVDADLAQAILRIPREPRKKADVALN